ncbi:long-chain fatty acid--CoA ligase [Alteribacillus sp. JSM 102045]|uniref:long-chain fatty acid--CoA ligase n=1 Tax=Alteribacillus sp. JSM 102045 TaxID=1562101 RepID=UPI0035BF1215
MMDTQLLIPSMLERAEKYFPKKEVISRTANGIHHLTYKEIGERTRRLASALEQLGVKKGDRVATFAWNHHRHLEAYFAILGIGAILHTINIRLQAEHISYIVNHAEDKIILVDAELIPLLEKVKDSLQNVEAFIVLCNKEVPETSLPNVYAYEALLEKSSPNYEFVKDIDENENAGICYTSATTGNPKGVMYSHRGIVLHSMAIGLADSAALSEKDTIMPVVPMFHANAWGLPFAAVWFGSTQVMPGPQFTPGILAKLIEDYSVTLTAGVPTIWLGLLKELENGSYKTDSLRAIMCGGSAAPAAMIRAFETKYNIPFLHAYGMTETSPLVSVATLKSYQEDIPEDKKLAIRSTQGIVVPGLEVKVEGPDGEVKKNGEDMGELLVKGPWIASEYYNDERSKDAFRDGWLHTGDVATMDEEGYIRLVDRTKDLVKSGGEWISSVDIENAIMAHEAVYEAAVIAVPHPQWQERPLACVVLNELDTQSVTKEEIIDFIRPEFAKWWLPDDVIFMKKLPKTSVGKFLKRALRDQLETHYTKA